VSVRKDISGQVINKWRVLSYSHTKGKVAYYNCICLVCGKDFVVDGRNIRSGKYDSQTAAFRGLFSRYKKDAKKRKKVFNISFEDFKDLVTGDCHYCGVKPNTKVNPLKNTGRSTERENEGWITYNGIDRVNSSIGYKKENVVTCCETCNKAKLTMSIDEFKEWIKRIYSNINNF